VRRDFRTAGLDGKTLTLLEYADALTRAPGRMSAGHVQRLRDAGWTDTEIVHAAQVCAYFNYINRIAEGLGVDPEPEMPPRS
jgi:uncharacterized peroxidase-related enzyme